jgi:glutamate formiminotransferase
VLECVINVSEGRRPDVLEAIADATGPALLDLHADYDHNRAVFTLSGPDVEAAARSLATAAVEAIDLGSHLGAHPRTGAVDVVPFVPLAHSSMGEAIDARDAFAAWMEDELGVPCRTYGPGGPSLPDLRAELRGVAGHPTAGVCCVGARPVLVAYNVWLREDLRVEVAREIAAELRGPAVRALGLDVGGRAQVSFNLIDPATVGPDAAFDGVATRAAVARAELVGLVRASVLEAIPPDRWTVLDLAPSSTIEARLEEAGLDRGSFG